MPRGKKAGFGDVGLERGEEGEYRHVMFIARESVVVLDTTVPEDATSGVYPGKVTYIIKATEWGVKSDIDLAEMLKIHEKDGKVVPELLK